MTAPDTPARIAEDWTPERVRALLERADLGELEAETYDSTAEAQAAGGFEWVSNPEHHDPFEGKRVGAVYERTSGGGTTGLPGCIEVSADHAALFAAAPDALRYLLGELERAHAELERERGALEVAPPYWLTQSLATYAGGECLTPDMPCGDRGLCVTEHCAPCAARWWAARQALAGREGE